ncbi:Rieske 2Fe-2S domain-containing protein [Sinorhizobium meliloti WSM1022]|jgi:3-phenylpropionate/trans-cinnamate dioxygenase ferredoxin subunit|uniref:Dioxygenase ferredoxin n=5 Tax=Sinorhizobium TaxID=28105 RepID=Q92MT3_RHIME|nr:MULTISPECIES: MocE family 2Fe-2S type ferredoxin [Sinorhizobium]PST24446.1 Rieske family ferredoxin [Mesorhizobium loti]TWA97635.1 3-phenylpropionate/trans-cinnamate dioxygenase ferredoxin subunit [Ensifer sp. SEMIA 134]TWB33181.1 3-phenylpropionate/trans-cinnamate dioxygenase ferredoxin subunit [Ensifer sp. SEMIA 135]AEG54290.1 Rieske (2Fe-2S) domain protein, MocE subfamily [Sinorhizobium meliloti AK83]AEH79934.1 dioxygenase ferredoxin [Sinorhizobium meliloti SM11]
MLDDRNWVKACDAKKVGREDVARWDHSGRSFAIFRTADDQYYATDDICTHEYAHISDGFVEGTTVECPRHAGCFDFRTGEALNPPVCVNLRTFPVKVVDGAVYIDIDER